MQSLNTRSVVFNLLAINVVVFLISSAKQQFMFDWFALYYPASPMFKPVQLVSHMFMHGNFMHIFSNMFGLYMFGTTLERVWGPKRFLLFYFVTGLGAMLLHTAVHALIVYNISGSVAPPMSTVMQYEQLQSIYYAGTVGASGAIFGILIAFGMMFPNTELILLFFPVPIKAKYFVLLYVLFELYSGFQMNPSDNVAHFAHLGGALFGFIMVKYWNRNRNYLY